jgi:ADP-ribose pyrophosphatase
MSVNQLKSWTTKSRALLYDGQPWLTVYGEDVELPDSRTVHGFYSIEMPDYAVVVALASDNRVVVELNYKHGPRRVCVNLPAGYLEPGENPLDAAKRELLEETGYVSDRWSFLGVFCVDGNRGCGRAHLYLATGARRVAEPASGDLEEMVIDLMTFSELSEATGRGETPLLGTVAALGLAAETLRRDGVL